jgi:hypothetical protein
MNLKMTMNNVLPQTQIYIRDNSRKNRHFLSLIQHPLWTEPPSITIVYKQF